MQNNLFGSALHHQIKNELDLIDADWNIQPEYPDLTGYKEVAVDLETYDPNIKTLGPGWARKDGHICLLYTSPSPRDGLLSRMPSSA